MLQFVAAERVAEVAERRGSDRRGTAIGPAAAGLPLKAGAWSGLTPSRRAPG